MLDERLSEAQRTRALRHRRDWREGWAGPLGDGGEELGVHPAGDAEALGARPLRPLGEITVRTTVEPLRRSPAHASEMVSEVRGGEKLRRLHDEGDWHLVAGEDDYVGWLHSWVVAPYPGTAEVVGRYAAPLGTLWVSDHVAAGPLVLGQPLLRVEGPMDERGEQRLVGTATGGEGWLPAAQILPLAGPGPVEMRRLLGWGRSLLGTPYRWGGRSPLGFDCSAFVQYLALLAGRRLPRDTTQQVECGTEVEASEAALQPGDLLFFGDPVDHVALFSGGGRILHCSGRVREEALRQNPQLAGRLRAVRRPWEVLEPAEATLWGARRVGPHGP